MERKKDGKAEGAPQHKDSKKTSYVRFLDPDSASMSRRQLLAKAKGLSGVMLGGTVLGSLAATSSSAVLGSTLFGCGYDDYGAYGAYGDHSDYGDYSHDGPTKAFLAIRGFPARRSLRKRR